MFDKTANFIKNQILSMLCNNVDITILLYRNNISKIASLNKSKKFFRRNTLYLSIPAQQQNQVRNPKRLF